jgi:hypothetical protein
MTEGLAEKEVMAGAAGPPALKVAIWATLSDETFKVQIEEIAPAALCMQSAEASALKPEAATARLVYPVAAEKVTAGFAPSSMAAVKIYSPLAEVVTGPTEMEVPLPVLFTAV